MNKRRCFWIAPTGEAFERLTVRGPGDRKCQFAPFYHTASNRGKNGRVFDLKTHNFPDVQYPTHCSGCGYPFTDTDLHTSEIVPIYRGIKPDGMEWRGAIEDAPVGAIFNDTVAAYNTPENTGPDGMCLFVRTPAGWWPVDYKSPDASFVRFGAPPAITVEGTVTVPNSYGTWSGSLVHGVLIDAPGVPAAN